MSQPPARSAAGSLLKEIFATIGQPILAVAALFVIATGLIYAVLPNDSERVLLSLMLGGLNAIIGLRAVQAIGWWRNGSPAEGVVGPFEGGDSSGLVDNSSDDMRRSVCAEALAAVAFGLCVTIGIATANTSYATVGLACGIASVVLSIALWLSVAASAKPQFLLPADFRPARTANPAPGQGRRRRAARSEPPTDRRTRPRPRRRRRSRKADR